MIVFGGDYAHTRWMSERTTPFRGLVYKGRPLSELYRMILARDDFEASEFSLSNYIMLRDKPDCLLEAIPAFPSRAFRHSSMYVRKNSEIRDFRELAGKRVGITEYTMTAAVWLRGIMHEHYDTHWRAIKWLSRPEKRFPPPDAANVMETHADLEELLLRGDIDALLKPQPRDRQRPPEERELRPLLDEVVGVEAKYLKDTGIFPIMHTVVIHRDILAEHPEFANAVYAFYEMGKARQAQLPRDDIAPYGIGPDNLRTVETLCRYLSEQKLIERSVDDVQSLFLKIEKGSRSYKFGGGEGTCGAVG